MKTSTINSLHVGLDAHLEDGVAGGVQQFVIGLAGALSKLTDGNETYSFFTFADADWLKRYISGPCQLIPTSRTLRRVVWKRKLKYALPIMDKAWQTIRRYIDRSVTVPVSDGTIEGAGIGVMHFPHQNGYLTHVPTIYHPWDLQHLYFPQFFSPAVIESRELLYRTLCDQAVMVSVASSCAKRDLLEHYRLPDRKIQVIAVPPVLSAYPGVQPHELEAVRKKFNLPENFIFYPAQMWPHKNHIGLLDALADLRTRYGLEVPLVSSGHLNEFFPTITRHAQRLHLTRHVHFLGFVSPVELQCLYRLCRFMVFPSRFEGWGLPITEAMMVGVPVACSNATCLPEQIGDAGLLFDPEDHRAIANAIYQLWTDHALRLKLIERGRQRVNQYSWDQTARLFRAHYRRIANRPLTDEDNHLLSVNGNG